MRFDYYKLAKILKDRRNQLKLTIRDIEDLIDVSHSEISRIENGFKPKIDVVTLIKLCEILDLDFVNLLKETNYLVGKNIRKRGMESMKKFKVLVQKSKQIELEVGSESEEKAVEMVDEILNEVDLFELDGMEIANEFTEMEIEEVEDDDEEIEEEFTEETEEKCCKNCPYFCSECGRCLL